MEHKGNRIEALRTFTEQQLFLEQGAKKARYFTLCHMSAVSQFCAMIALKRGQDAELATMAGLLHDYHTCRELSSRNHAKKGAELAKKVLCKLGLTTPEETELICTAIRSHSDKGGVHTPFAEVLVDADVLQHGLYNVGESLPEREHARFARLAVEFGFSVGAVTHPTAQAVDGWDLLEVL